MISLTRRKFLENLSAVAAGNFIAGPALLAARASDPEPHISFPTSPRDRIAVASYPFRAYINSPGNRDRNPSHPGMDLTQFPAEVVKKFGVHNIEPLSNHFASLDDSYLAKFREELSKANAKAVNIAVSLRESLYDPDPAARNKAIASAKKWVDVAVRIGSPGIRTHIDAAKDSKPDVGRASETLAQVAEYAEKKKVVAHLENDNPVSEDPFFIVQIIEKVNSPWLRALPDFGNSLAAHDEEFQDRAMEAMFAHAYGICHVKDGEPDDKGNPTHVDMAKTFGILKKHGYKGYCSIEYDAPGDPYKPTAVMVEQTIKFLS